jgi:carbamoyl-phosphate synthase large subunit
VIVVCSIENFDAMGVHTGDSITVAPQMTLSDRSIRRCAMKRRPSSARWGWIPAGSNIQFAVEPRPGGAS